MGWKRDCNKKYIVSTEDDVKFVDDMFILLEVNSGLKDRRYVVP
jgi:hypothetical protein